jgi:hypothetical protein
MPATTRIGFCSVIKESDCSRGRRFQNASFEIVPWPDIDAYSLRRAGESLAAGFFRG